MSICPTCRNKIEPPGTENRYCPYCGEAFVSPCENRPCAGAIIVGESATCPVCNSIYRYQSSPLLARLVQPGTPYGSAYKQVQTGARPSLIDLLPASGDSQRENAWLALEPSRMAGETPALARFQSIISRPVARHGRLYLLTQRGALEALNYDTLQRPADWPRVTVTPSRMENLDSLTLQVSDTVVYALHNRHLKAYDAGNGAALFELSVEDLDNPEACIASDRVLVIGQKGGRQQARLYDLPTLCDPIGSRQPLLQEELDAGQGSRLHVPAPAIRAGQDRFYVLTQSGELLTIPFYEGAVTTLYPNHAGAAIHAWALGPQQGALITRPLTKGGVYGLAAFTPGQANQAEYTDLHDLKPSEQAPCLLIWNRDALLLDQEGLLHRISAEAPGMPLDTWDFLGGLRCEGRDALELVAWAGHQYVFAHGKEGMSHRFRFAAISRADKRYEDVPLRPIINDAMSVAASGPFFYVCNLSRGEIHPYLVR